MADSNKATLAPSFPFYVRDWLHDPALRLCSLAARGLWIDMLCYMWDSPKRGFLLLPNRAQIESTSLAHLEAQPEASVKQSLSELEAHGVYSKTRAGTIYSRRMVRVEKQRLSKVEAGRKGGRQAKGKQKGVPASSSSFAFASASAKRKKNTGAFSISEESLKQQLPDYKGDLAGLLAFLQYYEASTTAINPEHVHLWASELAQFDMGKALKAFKRLRAGWKKNYLPRLSDVVASLKANLL